MESSSWVCWSLQPTLIGHLYHRVINRLRNSWIEYHRFVHRFDMLIILWHEGLIPDGRVCIFRIESMRSWSLSALLNWRRCLLVTLIRLRTILITLTHVSSYRIGVWSVSVLNQQLQVQVVGLAHSDIINWFETWPTRGIVISDSFRKVWNEDAWPVTSGPCIASRVSVKGRFTTVFCSWRRSKGIYDLFRCDVPVSTFVKCRLVVINLVLCRARCCA